MEDVVRRDRAKIAHHEPLLVGRVYIVQPRPADRPRLAISVWCPHCKFNHVHDWIDPPFSSDVALLVRPACKAGPYLLGGYAISLDKTRKDINGRIQQNAARLLQAWQARRLVGSQ